MGSGASSSVVTSTSATIKPLSNFYTIANNFKSFSDLQQGLKSAGLESSELIIGIDFTKSNLYNGAVSFGGKSLHELFPVEQTQQNPYEYVLEHICETMSAFDDDNHIPCYGFGDVTTRNQKVFSFKNEHLPCYGLQEVRFLYRDLLPNISLAGPTSFAPIIRRAIHTVVEHEYRYHVLLIIADGQVTDGDLQDTINSIVEASNFALSIIVVGVGDGPWELMQRFDDELPKRRFDNFQFVCMTEAIQQAKQAGVNPEIGFALQALMEIPEQYQLVRSLRLMDPAVGEKYFKRLKLKEIPCLNPPPPRSLPPNTGLFLDTNDSSHSFRNSAPTTSPERRRHSALSISTPTSAIPSAAALRSIPSFSAPSTPLVATDPPSDYLCPISHELMLDPVIAQDGFTYERSAIEMWFQNGNDTSPMTNDPLPSLVLLPNNNLKSQVTSWNDDRKRYLRSAAAGMVSYGN